MSHNFPEHARMKGGIVYDPGDSGVGGGLWIQWLIGCEYCDHGLIEDMRFNGTTTYERCWHCQEGLNALAADDAIYQHASGAWIWCNDKPWYPDCKACTRGSIAVYDRYSYSHSYTYRDCEACGKRHLTYLMNTLPSHFVIHRHNDLIPANTTHVWDDAAEKRFQAAIPGFGEIIKDERGDNVPATDAKGRYLFDDEGHVVWKVRDVKRRKDGLPATYGGVAFVKPSKPKKSTGITFPDAEKRESIYVECFIDDPSTGRIPVPQFSVYRGSMAEAQAFIAEHTEIKNFWGASHA